MAPRRGRSHCKSSGLSPPETAPAAPSGLTASAVSPNDIQLSWQANSSNQTGFEISNGVTSTDVGADSTSYTWGGLSPGTHMCFKILAYNSTGDSAWGPSVCTTTPSPPPAVPEITSVTTYTEGVFVYFEIHYADPGNDAEGFGFEGVNGSGWAEETHPFSSPSYGIVGPDSIAYPFNEACGTAQQYDSYVEAWIYDAAGAESTPVVIHLACASASGSAG